MSNKGKWLRFAIGVCLVTGLLVISFSLINQWIMIWGSTKEEQAGVYPGDDLLTNPLISWTHAITIHAPPEEVWPWVVQIGENRAAFYSYTFIENLVSGKPTYINANSIIAAYQDPQPGTEIINGMMYWKEIHPNEWILAEDNIPDLGWTWLWYLQPEGNQTRMIIRMRIETPPGMSGSPAIAFILNQGGFVMERNMMEGVRDRAEGRFEPIWIEYVEIALWLVAFLCGIVSAVRFVTQKDWLRYILTGLAAVFALIWFTFGQPPIWSRVVVDGLLIVGVLFFHPNR